MKEEKELLERAHRWFTITYEQTPEQAGCRCAKIWYKPIMGYSLKVNKYAEVVFGPGDNEVNAFIKAQTLMRRGLNWAIMLMLLNGFGLMGMMYSRAANNIDALIGVVVVFCSIDLIAVIVFLWCGSYVKPLEKAYRDKVVTYMDK